MSRTLYPRPHTNQYGLSSDEDCLLEEEEEVEVSMSRTQGKGKGRTKSSTPSSRVRFSNSMKPLSKYDHKPRNMEFDGSNFVATRRRSSGSEHRDRQSEATMETSTVSFSEFELPVEGEGHRSEVEERDDVWWFSVGRIEMWQVIALGCFMGLLLGILYRGGIGGLYLGFFPRGKRCFIKHDSM